MNRQEFLRATAGVSALVVAGSLSGPSKIHSRRLADEVRELGRLATRHRRLDDVARLRQRIDSVVQPA